MDLGGQVAPVKKRGYSSQVALALLLARAATFCIAEHPHALRVRGV